VLTKTGLNKIEFRPMTLADKADYFDRKVRSRHIRSAEWGRYAARLESAYGSDWWRQFDLRDTQIAAIAREYGFTIATRKIKHFPFCTAENPFS
jgi:predicted nucleic acid-binding protein